MSTNLYKTAESVYRSFYSEDVHQSFIFAALVLSSVQARGIVVGELTIPTKYGTLVISRSFSAISTRNKINSSDHLSVHEILTESLRYNYSRFVKTSIVLLDHIMKKLRFFGWFWLQYNATDQNFIFRKCVSQVHNKESPLARWVDGWVGRHSKSIKFINVQISFFWGLLIRL
jgi:hypothetical protein